MRIELKDHQVSDFDETSERTKKGDLGYIDDYEPSTTRACYFGYRNWTCWRPKGHSGKCVAYISSSHEYQASWFYCDFENLVKQAVDGVRIDG